LFNFVTKSFDLNNSRVSRHYKQRYVRIENLKVTKHRANNREPSNRLSNTNVQNGTLVETSSFNNTYQIGNRFDLVANLSCNVCEMPGKLRSSYLMHIQCCKQYFLIIFKRLLKRFFDKSTLTILKYYENKKCTWNDSNTKTNIVTDKKFKNNSNRQSVFIVVGNWCNKLCLVLTG